MLRPPINLAVDKSWRWGGLAPLVTESFIARLRHSGASLGYQFAPIVVGGRAPVDRITKIRLGLSVRILHSLLCDRRHRGNHVVARSPSRDFSGARQV